MHSQKKQKVALHSNKWVSVYHHQVHSIFDELIHKTWGHQHWHAAADVVETVNDFSILIDLPGVEPDNLAISLDDNILIVQAVRRSNLPNNEYQTHLTQRPVGKCYCSFEFPGRLDADKMSKTFDKGVLSIIIPKEK